VKLLGEELEYEKESRKNLRQCQAIFIPGSGQAADKNSYGMTLNPVGEKEKGEFPWLIFANYPDWP
jgi:hypothetical protein